MPWYCTTRQSHDTCQLACHGFVPGPVRGSGSAPISVLVLDGHDAGLCDESMNKPLVLLLTFGTGGDLQPFLALAAGLQRRGSGSNVTWLRSSPSTNRFMWRPAAVALPHLRRSPQAIKAFSHSLGRQRPVRYLSCPP
ncbi:glycosyltransferase [Roseateles sp.]|uniref:glycosyltransferase n=1 Tax=Roseateles sp. TaxID=1971397 RepID=UPI00396477E9